eukprot:2894460-Amphidinium_carterae.1
MLVTRQTRCDVENRSMMMLLRSSRYCCNNVVAVQHVLLLSGCSSYDLGATALVAGAVRGFCGG